MKVEITINMNTEAMCVSFTVLGVVAYLGMLYFLTRG